VRLAFARELQGSRPTRLVAAMKAKLVMGLATRRGAGLARDGGARRFSCVGWGWHLAAAMVAVGLGLALAQRAAADEPRKVLRLAFRVAETSFDPAKVNDLYSRTVTPHIFEALYQYDHLARPAKIKPLLAQGMPASSADFRTWTVRVRPGIYFADDPAFKGTRREVTAKDFVFAFQRHADPATKSPNWGFFDAQLGFVGLAEVRKAALDGNKPFDYDAPIEGLQALDRYTIQFKLREPRPRFIEQLAGSDLIGAQAREVVEYYGDQIDAHPVGTGPFRLKQWRRSSLIVLERSPDYRGELYDAEPAEDDSEGQALLARFKGRRLPMVDEVRISIIEEAQPFWLAFLNGEIDAVVGQTGAVPGEFVTQAAPNGRLAPNLAKRGIQMRRQVNSDSAYVYFNMEDPVVGGYTPEKVALRRAIGLAIDVDKLIRVGYRGQAIVAQDPTNPHTTGYEPKFKSEMGDYSPARAKALLDLYGYVDRDGDGWRDLPDGRPLVIDRASQPDQLNREFLTLWQKDLQAVGIRTISSVAQWPEQLKQARAGKLQVWALGGASAQLDGQGALARYDSTQWSGQNLARFRNAGLDAIYKQMSVLPDGPERLELFRQVKLIATAYMPYKFLVHRISTDMWHPWVVGYRRPLFWEEWWHMVDIDPSKVPAK
jgi:ABC-type transport system substrate-binding protein